MRGQMCLLLLMLLSAQVQFVYLQRPTEGIPTEERATETEERPTEGNSVNVGIQKKVHRNLSLSILPSLPLCHFFHFSFPLSLHCLLIIEGHTCKNSLLTGIHH